MGEEDWEQPALGGINMLHQRVDPFLTLDDRPDRDTVIEKDEILSLIIDVETMTTVDFYNKYFSLEEKP